ncbi:hypothetical protein [Xylocopilactobacillus apicola]|uniref:Uncharacterized protein n=1 Tax=Xylocopilactobacillus apicola TaxID=2932184 RepID=A0AAU9DLN1_9LACO|nr:hypothetical protein [Xylocopilactobacillus apicola]BDR59461.1 hypothetical protein XA3_19020 [Xylocopilactobacillus apicola]
MKFRNYFNLTFEQSEKITKNHLSKLTDQINEEESLTKKKFKNYFTAICANAGVFLLCYSPVFIGNFYPKFFIEFSKSMGKLVLWICLIFAIIFILNLRKNTFIHEEIFVQFYLIPLLCFAAFSIMGLIIFPGTRINARLSMTPIIPLYIVTGIISFMNVRINYITFNDEIEKYNQENSMVDRKVVNPRSVESRITIMNKMLFYIEIPLFVIALIRGLYLCFLEGKEFMSMLEYVGAVVIVVPLIIYSAIYLFYYEFAEILLPDYYLLKYRNQYEEKYKINFGGTKNE